MKSPRIRGGRTAQQLALFEVTGRQLLLVVTHPFNGPFPGIPRWAGTRKVKTIWILEKQETVSGSGVSWAICKSAPCSRQTTTPLCFYRQDALPAAQPTASKHWRQLIVVTSAVFAIVVCPPCVCPSQAGIVSKRLHGRNRRLVAVLTTSRSTVTI